MDKDEFSRITQEIGKTTNADDTVLSQLAALQNAYNEQNDELTELHNAPAPPSGFASWQDAYNDANTRREELHNLYVERFLEAPKQTTTDPTPDDDTPKKYEDLFSNKE